MGEGFKIVPFLKMFCVFPSFEDILAVYFVTRMLRLSIQILSSGHLKLTALKTELFACGLICAVSSVSWFTAVASTVDALPIPTTERHVTVGWCHEGSRDVWASRHLVDAGSRCF